MKSEGLPLEGLPDPSTVGNCFGCSPGNLRGLRLTFRHEGTRVSTEVCLGRDFESFPGIVHGGIIATVLDEIMARTSLYTHGLPTMTVGMRLRFVQVMKAGQPHLATAEVLSRDGNLVRIEARIESAQDGLVAAADGTFFLLSPEDLATSSSKLGLPAETLEAFHQYMRRIATR